ncbi:MAG: xanthine dehydrogenase family protein molybdopterin-binding subunit, partial [Candidatus Atribacteria bacterium]|nr:xanthine dehydrogenase family protein molybdopterin-binding subunit [Candidatus Atribacteria bacterium]
VENEDSEGPFGAKGIGEPGTIATAPAIANAIYDAIGVRIYHLPITPEKILKALKEGKNKK